MVLPKDIMNIQEASAFLAMEERDLWRLAEERRIPSLQHNGQWAFSRKSLEKWRQAQTRRRA